MALEPNPTTVWAKTLAPYLSALTNVLTDCYLEGV